MSTPQQPSGDDEVWAWPADPSRQAQVDLAHHLEAAARALRENRAVVRRSATCTTSTGPNRLDVDLSWSPPGVPDVS